MKLPRASGILLHIASLPGSYGMGTLGDEAYLFADSLKKAGQSYWQILPINPVAGATAYSPYASTSTFAGNDLFISPELLSREKWFSGPVPGNTLRDESFIDYGAVLSFKEELLAKAFTDFFSNAGSDDLADFDGFCREMEFWLGNYALFTSLAGHFNTNNWLEWDKDISARDPVAAQRWSGRLEKNILACKFRQFIFFRQWAALKKYCTGMGISLIGDIPIYVTTDSADVWAYREIFQLDGMTGLPEAVSGVPPDYFSETGQHWGNPLYNWFDETGALNEMTLDWWAMRLLHLRKTVDLIRIDHFRGFEAYWSIPAGEKTAEKGDWIQGPGIEFFKKLAARTGKLSLIAEDLGVITPEVEKLRDGLDLPGMRILQFAFDFNNRNYYLPHNIDNRNCLLYTGTHDNNTTNGWFYGNEIDENTRRYILEYLGSDSISDFHWQLIRAAFRSVASLVIVPAQDLLGFGADFRMNTPGTVKGNWVWKMKKGDLTDHHLETLRRMGEIYSRLPAHQKDDGR